MKISKAIVMGVAVAAGVSGPAMSQPSSPADPRPGRFQLVISTEAALMPVFLLDTQNGWTWALCRSTAAASATEASWCPMGFVSPQGRVLPMSALEAEKGLPEKAAPTEEAAAEAEGASPPPLVSPLPMEVVEAVPKAKPGAYIRLTTSSDDIVEGEFVKFDDRGGLSILLKDGKVREVKVSDMKSVSTGP